MIHENILGIIGNTPLVRIKGREGSAEIVAKLEYLNPGGSVKDRIAFGMLSRALEQGKLASGQKIVEPTSGNTGIGIAMVAAVLGNEAVLVMPEKMSFEKEAILRALGAKIVRTPTEAPPESPESDIMVARKLANELGGFLPFQYDNEENWKTHYRTTGPEIWQGTGGKIDAIVVGAGTGGTITGIGKFLKERNPKILVVAVDAEGSIFSQVKRGESPSPKPYGVEGIGNDFLPKNLDLEIIDEIVTVSDSDAFSTARELAKREGIFAGGSSGAAVFAAREIAKRLGPGKRVVTLLPDRGERYLSKFHSGGN